MPDEALEYTASHEYYVIVGCGFSAVVNHTMLVHLKIAGVPGTPHILHIGSTDPWSDYLPLPMGQWPTLLSLPGFHNNPPKLSQSAPLQSTAFAWVTELEWNHLVSTAPFYHIDAKVTSITAPFSASSPYTVSLDNGIDVRAVKIDICGGPGPALPLVPTAFRRSPGLLSPPTVLETEYANENSTVFGWPRVLSGSRYLSGSKAKTQRTVGGGSVCVAGGGATAAWCVERAQGLGETVYWLSRESLQSAFVSSRRNDGLLQGPVTRKFDKGNHVIDIALRPASLTTTFGEGVEIYDLTTNSAGQVELKIQPYGAATPKFTDNKGPIAAIHTLTVDQVIVSFGQQFEFSQSESWAAILSKIVNANTLGNPMIKGRDGCCVGLRSADQRVRILGSAALTHPDLAPEWKKSGTPSNLFFRSLPEQARVFNGITLAAITIAEANNFWTATVNDNINTASLSDLQQLLASWTTALDGANTWFETRAVRVTPFDPQEFLAIAKHKTHY